MRVTQMMLSNSNLKYISQNYRRLATLQDQVNTGKKITKPSDDPVIAMKGMRYRSQLVEVKQFSRNLTEGFTWMNTADAALDETTLILNRIRDLAVQASNDSYDPVARGNIEKEITQLQQHLTALANTKIGDNYIFNGTNTDSAPIDENSFNVKFIQLQTDLTADSKNGANYAVTYQGRTYKYYNIAEDPSYDPGNIPDHDPKFVHFKSTSGDVLLIDKSAGEVTLKLEENLKYEPGNTAEFREKLDINNLIISNKNAVSTNEQDIEIEVMKGVTIPINVQGQNAFSMELFGGIESIKKMLTNPDTKGNEITKALDSIDSFLNGVVSTRAELGARQNRAEMVEDRLIKQEIIARQTVSDNEDIEMEEAIIDLTIQESIHRASLAVGARILQPTLMDFLR